MTKQSMRFQLIFTTFLCATCLSSASSALGTEESVLQDTELVCQTDITWTRQSKNQWISEEGLILDLYDEAEVGSPYFPDDKETFAVAVTPNFWDSSNASEAEAVLEELAPGEEINVTDFFLRRGADNNWRIDIYFPGQCPLGLKCVFVSPYQIHYLYRPAEDWVIDRLMTRAQGLIAGEFLDPANPRLETHIILEGPYLPIFEGRFRQGESTFWFLARDHDGITNYRTSLLEGEERLELFTTEVHFETLQAINEFLKSCTAAKS